MLNVIVICAIVRGHVAREEEEECSHSRGCEMSRERSRDPFGGNTTSSPLIPFVCALDLWSSDLVAGDPLPPSMVWASSYHPQLGDKCLLTAQHLCPSQADFEMTCRISMHMSIGDT